MGTGIFGIGVSALGAAQAGLLTTQNNIANVNTAGYARREVTYTPGVPTYSNGSLFGSGVQIESVRRVYSQFLDNEVLLSQAMAERYSGYAQRADALDKLLGSANTGLSSAMQLFFSAANEVANDPTSTAARQSLISSGETLASRFRNVEGTLAALQKGINEEIGVTVTQINTLAGQVAALNDRIGRFEAATGQPANDLIDKRAQLVEELSKLVNVTVMQQDGGYNLMIGSGQMLVMGVRANTLTTVPDPTDPQNLLPAIGPAGAAITLDGNQITGGSLGGLLAFRDELLKPAQSGLDRLAYALADQFNALHSTGEDLNGNTGIDFFSLATSQTALNLGGTTATVGLSVTDSRQLMASDYILSYDGTNYTLTRGTDGARWTSATLSGFSASGQGFDLSGAAGAVAGDRWLIRPAHNAARSLDVAIGNPDSVAAAAAGAGPGDNSVALQLAALQTDTTAIGGTTTYSGAYGRLVSHVATLTHESRISAESHAALASATRAQRDSVSGVNLDEEAVRLVQFQQAYQAAARAIQVSSDLFDELLAIGR